MLYKNENLALIRAEMKKRGLKGYLIVTGDPHSSEEPAPYFAAERRFACPFTGDNAYVLITEDEALLWTDGRFFISAEKEIEGTPYKLMKMGTPGYPTLEEYLLANGVYPLGTNFLMFAESSIQDLAPKGCEVVDADLSFLLSSRPDFPNDRLWRFDDPELNRMFDEICRKTREKGKLLGVYAENHFDRWIARGVQYISCINDTSAMMLGFREMQQRIIKNEEKQKK